MRYDAGLVLLTLLICGLALGGWLMLRSRRRLARELRRGGRIDIRKGE